jgi:uncharacterized protein (TIGR03435 family)
VNLTRGVLTILLMLLAIAPSSAQKPSFEVASVKRNISGREGGSLGPRGDRLLATNLTLRNLMVYAFGPPKGALLRQQIIGSPEWMDTDRFDVEAKVEGNTRSIPAEQLRPMLQVLLEDRFRLQVHRETRELPVYNFVVARGGPKMSADQTPPDPSKGFITFDSDPAPSAPLPRGAIHLGRTTSGTTLSGTGVAVPLLMSLLQGESDRIIIDKTDFKGLLDIQLRFTDSRKPRAIRFDSPFALHCDPGSRS